MSSTSPGEARVWPFERYGFEVDKGWEALVVPFCRNVTACGGKILQVKEKFGGLRLYYSMPETPIASNPHKAYTTEWYEMENLIRFAQNHEVIYRYLEDISFSVCEVCGDAHTAKVRSGGWLKTRCDSCEEKHNGKVQD